ncbi:hypothetical protein [Bacillus niameyensis]|uniref:hypothetical protein n=1 Tax=Bacillus niameyensis TaxID=1522308 RepID=UPI000784B940|nr:hypothetical protein [Bacillus niameyensis]
MSTNTIDLEKLKEQYGDELAEKLKYHLNLYSERNWKWKFEVVKESDHFITFALANYGACHVFEIAKSSKRITDNYIIGSLDCEKILGIINSVGSFYETPK